MSFSAASYSAAEIQAAVSVLQGALDAGADLAIYFGGWSPLQRRALTMSLGSAEAAVAEAKASAKAPPPVKKAPAVPPAKPASPAPTSSTVTQPAPEPLGHLDGSGAAGSTTGDAGGFGKSPPPAVWNEVGFQSVEHAEMAAAMNYASATAFYATMGRGDLQVGPTPRPPPPRRTQPEAAASSTDGPGGALGGYLSELQAKAASPPGMRAELAEHERRYRQIVDDRMALCSAEWCHHIRDMHMAGAESTEPIVDPDLQQLAVANMMQLADLERRAGTGEGQMMPVADEAAYFFLRKLPPGVRGMRVPERLTGEVWVIGWCGRPCPNAGARCLSSVERCLRPVVVRRGEGANLGDLEHHEHHECAECHRASRRGREF